MSSDPTIAVPVRLRDVLDCLALELAFLQPGGSVERVRTLFEDVERLCGAGDPPNILRLAVAACGTWLDAAADAGLSSTVIARLNEWQPWMMEATTAWERGRPSPPATPPWLTAAASDTPAATPPDTAGPTGAVALESEEVAVLQDGGDPELWAMFCSEAQDLLEEIERSVLVLEEAPADAERLNTLFRAFHTLKGNASVLKLAVLQRFTHEVESLLDLARRGRLTLGREAFDVVLLAADVIRQFVAELERQTAGHDPGRRITLPLPGVIDRVRTVIAGGPTPKPHGPARAADPVVPPPADTPRNVPATEAESPARGGDVVVVPPEAVGAATPAAVVPTVSAPPSGPSAPAGGLVRIDTLKLDGLIDMVGELVVAQSMVVQNPDLARLESPQLTRCLGQLRGITGQLQRLALALRMVPVGATFRRMTRLVRDLAADLGKEIRLDLEGEDTELDRTIVEDLGDPLVHLIRNSADHGLESPEERAAAGKPRTGTIRLKAFHRGGSIVVQISDDGRGLDAARILRKAVERGLVRPEERLDEAACHDLIFLPGFSTAEQVTDVSGRGVGMDVVRRTIAKIRGRVEVESVPGQGTTFTISLPLTLAIIDGLIVGVGDQRYIIPALSVRESFRPLPGAVTTVHGRGELVTVRGRLVPLVRLGRHLGVPARAEDPPTGIVVVVDAGQERRCLLADELVGKQEVVIKSLGEPFSTRGDFAGAAILGDGRVGLILDLGALGRRRTPSGDAAA